MSKRLWAGVVPCNASDPLSTDAEKARYRRLVPFWSATVPTETTHGDRFTSAIGPFRTLAALRYMREHYWCDNVYFANKMTKGVAHATSHES
jgi:hypothetical protein